MSTIKQQSQLDDLSAEADARVVRTEDISGILLHLAFFHMRSAESSLRKSGYSLLLALRHSYGLKISFPLFASESVFIPVLSSDFVVQLSGELSINHPELAVAFTSECVSCLGNSKISLKQKIACIQYLKPWIATFSNKVKSHNLNYEINELQANQKVLSNERFFDVSF